MPMTAYARPEMRRITPVTPIAGVRVGWSGSWFLASTSGELVASGATEIADSGAGGVTLSLVDLGAGVVIGGARLDPVVEMDDSSSEGSAVAEGRVEAPLVNEGSVDCWVGLSSCRRRAACGAAVTE
jgi:hypothetical protein